MLWQTLHIGFRGRRVAVRTNVPGLTARVRGSFQEMLVEEPASSSAQPPDGLLEVRRSGLAYTLLKNGEVCLEDRAFAVVRHRLRHEIIRQMIGFHPELLWLHAGGAVGDGRAVLLAGAFGRGKSTLTTALVDDGWQYLSDDTVPVDRARSAALAFPLTPNVRARVGLELPPERISELRRRKVRLDPETIYREAAPVTAIVFPAYRFQAPVRLAHCSPAKATVELLQRCLNFGRHRSAAVGYFAELLRRVPVFTLTYSDVAPAVEQIARMHAEAPLLRSRAA